MRARDYLAQVEAEYDAKRQELGVADELKEVPGVSARMLVALGENGVKTVEDLAGCATDDLAGWTERKDGETIRTPGFLDGFDLTREDCEAIIMQARVKAGWITEADLAVQQAPPAAPDEAEAAAEQPA
jgi:transcription termination/antitermination protein NusA